MSANILGRFICILALLFAGLAGSSVALAQGANVTARNATSVTVTERGKPHGEIRKVDATTWVEFDASGEALFKYDEVKRDDNTVYLADPSRDVSMQLDIRKRSVTLREATTMRRAAYQIQNASDAPIKQMVVLTAGQVDSAGKARPGVLPAAKAETGGGFCLLDIISRGPGSLPGRLADCPEGYSLSAGSCKRAASSIAAPSRAADCPEGYKNTGSSCERPAANKPNANSRLADCPDGFNNTGGACFRLSAPAPLDASKMTCKGGESRIGDRCYKACETGFTAAGANCTRPAATLGADRMTCKSGFKKDAKGGQCSAVCAAGFTNNGEACVRPADTVGVDGMVCKAGETRVGGRCLSAGGSCADGEVQQGELCYKACAPGYDGIGGSCIKQAPKSLAQCGVGAAKDAQACAAASLSGALAVRQNAVLVGQAGTSRLGKERSLTKKKFRDLTDAYAKVKDTPAFKKGVDAWEAMASSGGARLPMGSMASAANEEDMVRYAAQAAQIAELAGAGDDTSFPKCSSLPSK